MDNLASHSFDCPVKHDGEHDPRTCAADDGKADAHQRETDWYERHLKQAERERDEARAEVERLQRDNVIYRACANGYAESALRALMEMTGSYNSENPWLGITAAVALLRDY